ncbi:MAG: RelA/SpoT domain-containing protein [Candidatus Competibacteraceae bacterium]|nr:RelA/SpoT domain-containing protein [Candidatus Competibacteraceae bacterium]
MSIEDYYKKAFSRCVTFNSDSLLAISGHHPCQPRLHLPTQPPLDRYVSVYLGQSPEQLAAASFSLQNYLPELLGIAIQEGVEYPLVTRVFIYTSFEVENDLASFVQGKLGSAFEVVFRPPTYATRRDELEALLSTFLYNYSSTYFKDFELVTAAVRSQIETRLKAQEVLAWVSSRTKSSESLTSKLWSRALSVDESILKDYRVEADIFSDMADLTGIRVALYFPSEREAAAALISSMFTCLEVKSYPDNAVKPTFEKRFSGYWAKHVRVLVTGNDLKLSNPLQLGQFRCEVQIGSVIMHAWSEVEHDLLYKRQKVHHLKLKHNYSTN